MTRQSGLLLPLSALPGPFGIGTFGPEAVAFARLARSLGFSFWQVLPFSSPGPGFSPYLSPSAFALNPDFIDPRPFLEKGWLADEELDTLRIESPFRVARDRLGAERRTVFRKAFDRLGAGDRSAVAAFMEKESFWLPDFALFCALSDRFGGVSFQDWPDRDLVRRRPGALRKAKAEWSEEVLFHGFLQWVADTQWQECLVAIHREGIDLIGDLPIYVAPDGADVWAHPEWFQLGADRRPRRVAGVPPDAFAENGQFWGNPLYRWRAMALGGHRFWKRRMARTLALFDRVRLDHFRGFADYWSIPSGAPDARSGRWVRGPGMGALRPLLRLSGPDRILAEDLGDIDDRVRRLLARSGLPGMRVLQFAFDGDPDNPYLPYHIPRNSVAYTGTHDNDTLLGWLYEASPESRRQALDCCGHEGGDWGQGGFGAPAVRAMIRTLWMSPAELAIAPIQDFLGYGSDTRINRPGTPEDNWLFRADASALALLEGEAAPWIRSLNRAAGRA